MSGFLIFIGLIIAAGLFVITIYNRIVALSQRTEQAFADVDVQLRQRHDLIPNLVETVKGYASHEKETLDAVISARNAAQAASGPAAQGQAEGVLGAALGKLFALAEAYPDLKANTNFLELQRELSRRCEVSRPFAVGDWVAVHAATRSRRLWSYRRSGSKSGRNCVRPTDPTGEAAPNRSTSESSRANAPYPTRGTSPSVLVPLWAISGSSPSRLRPT